MGFLLNTFAAVTNAAATIHLAFEGAEWTATFLGASTVYWSLNAIYKALEETR